MESANADFEDLCKCLNAHRVDYLIVGGHALAVHGAPLEGVSLSELASGRKILQMGREPWQVHVMTEITGVSWDEAWHGRHRGTYGHTPTCYIGRAELIRN